MADMVAILDVERSVLAFERMSQLVARYVRERAVRNMVWTRQRAATTPSTRLWLNALLNEASDPPDLRTVIETHRANQVLLANRAIYSEPIRSNRRSITLFIEPIERRESDLSAPRHWFPVRWRALVMTTRSGQHRATIDIVATIMI